MVQTGSHQAAMRSSTKFRLLGKTHNANVFLRRNLAAVSGKPAAHFQLHKDGVARDVDDFGSHESGMYPIEDIIAERVTNGRTQYQVSWAGNWPKDQKTTWVDADDCEAYDISNFRIEQQIAACKARDIEYGIPADGSGAVSTNRRSRSRRSASSIQKPQFGSGKRGAVRPSETFKRRSQNCTEKGLRTIAQLSGRFQ